MRQSRTAVQSTLELDVWHVEYIESEIAVTDAVIIKEANAKPTEVMTSLRGKLLLRTGNVGKKMTSLISDGGCSFISLTNKLVVLYSKEFFINEKFRCRNNMNLSIKFTFNLLHLFLLRNSKETD